METTALEMSGAYTKAEPTPCEPQPSWGERGCFNWGSDPYSHPWGTTISSEYSKKFAPWKAQEAQQKFMTHTGNCLSFSNFLKDEKPTGYCKNPLMNFNLGCIPFFWEKGKLQYLQHSQWGGSSSPDLRKMLLPFPCHSFWTLGCFLTEKCNG